MGKRRDWVKIGEVVEKVRELQLTYKQGADRFGVKVKDLYDYNRRENKRGAVLEEQPTEDGGPGTEETGTKVRGVQLPEDVQELIRSHRREHPTRGKSTSGRVAARTSTSSRTKTAPTT